MARSETETIGVEATGKENLPFYHGCDLPCRTDLVRLGARVRRKCEEESEM